MAATSNRSDTVLLTSFTGGLADFANRAVFIDLNQFRAVLEVLKLRIAALSHEQGLFVWIFVALEDASGIRIGNVRLPAAILDALCDSLAHCQYSMFEVAYEGGLCFLSMIEDRLKSDSVNENGMNQDSIRGQWQASGSNTSRTAESLGHSASVNDGP
jgi:hypothetical protein